MKEIVMKMSEICDLIGISPQAIRMYEKHGSFPSFKWNGNGYRYYYFENLGPAIGMRSYRQLGISLKESARLCSGTSVQELQKALALQQQKQLREIKRQQALLQCNRQMSCSLQDAITQYGHFAFRERPALYFLRCEEDGKIFKNDEMRKLIRSWSAEFPFVKFCPLVEWENLGEDTVSRVGFCVEEEYKEFVPHLNHPRVQYYPKQRCIGGITRVAVGTADYYSVVADGVEYLYANKLELSGDILTLLIAPAIKTLEPQEVVADYHYIWLPVQEA